MLNILYITYDGLTDHLGQSQVLPYLSGLSKKGYQIHVLSFEKKAVFEKRKKIIKKHTEEANIIWYPKFYTKFPPVLSTIFDIYILIKWAKKIHRTNNINIVHCRSYIASFGGLMLKKKFGLKFVFDMRGFWSDERVEGNVWNLKNPIFKRVYNYFKKKEKTYFENADYTISLTREGKNVIRSWQFENMKHIPIEVIPCCANFDHFCQNTDQQRKTENLKKELGIQENDFILSYLGSVGTWYMLDEMLDFFNTLLQTKPDAKFLFISGESEEFIRTKAIEKKIIHDKIIVRKAEREDVPAFIAISSVSIFFIKPVFSKKASSPTKMAEIMGMGIPIICNSNVGDVEKIIQETKAGLLVNEFNEIEYQKAIDQLDDLLKTDPQKIRQAAIERFSLKDGVEKYHQVYQKLLK
jgi:glycosyltransferase involved in cell wall biosynthesis